MSQMIPRTQVNPLAKIKDMIESQASQIALVVSGSTQKERQERATKFGRICFTAVRNTKHLAECSIESLAAAMMTSAQLDLEPNTPQGLAYLIPYKTKKGYECQFQVGYKGLLQLAYRSGMVQAFNADVVYKAEVEAGLFRYTKGACPNIIHETDLLGDYRQGEIVAAYAACTLKGGQTIMRVIDKKDVERAQNTSASFKAAQSFGRPDMSPWNTNPEAMWMKTAIKRLAAWMPQVEILNLAAYEDSKADRETIEATASKTETETLNQALAAASVAPLPQAKDQDDEEDYIDTSVAEEQQPQPAPVQQQPQQEQATRKPRMTQEELDSMRQEALSAYEAKGYDLKKAMWDAGGKSLETWTATDCKRLIRNAAKLTSLQQEPATEAEPEQPQEQGSFQPPYQTFTCPNNGAQVTEDDCYDCPHRNGCPAHEGA